MKVNFQYTKAEYARALWMHSKQNMRSKLDAPLSVLALFFGGYLLIEGQTLWGSLILGVVGLFVLFYIIARYIIPAYVYKYSVADKGEYSFEFTQDGIHFTATNIDSQLDWSLFTHVVVGTEHYLLYYGKHQYVIIPRRIFKSPSLLDEFDQLLQQKIPKRTVQ